MHKPGTGIHRDEVQPALHALRPPVFLGVGVLLAHAVLLQDLSDRMQTPSRLETRAFVTRSLSLGQSAAPPQLPRRPVTAVPRATPTVRAPSDSEGVLAAAVRLPTPELPTAAPIEAPASSPIASGPVEPSAPVIAAVEPQARTTVVASPPAIAVVEPAPIEVTAARPADAPSAPIAPTVAAGPAPLQPPPQPAQPPAAAFAITVPGSTHLEFDAEGRNRGLNYYATGELVWLHDGVSYEVQLKASALGVGARVLASVGKLTADGLAPRRYSDKSRRERAAHFDRSRNQVVFSANAPPVALKPGTQDRVSVFIQLVARVAGAPQDFPIGSKISFETVDASEMLPWTFEVERQETLTLARKQVPTLKLVRRPGRLYDQKIELWLAPELSYLPARIRITDANGNFMDQKWSATLPLPGAAASGAKDSADLKPSASAQSDR